MFDVGFMHSLRRHGTTVNVQDNQATWAMAVFYNKDCMRALVRTLARIFGCLSDFYSLRTLAHMHCSERQCRTHSSSSDKMNQPSTSTLIHLITSSAHGQGAVQRSSNRTLKWLLCEKVTGAPQNTRQTFVTWLIPSFLSVTRHTSDVLT